MPGRSARERFRLRRRAENVVVVAQGHNLDLGRRKAVGFAIIPLMGGRVGQDEIGQGEGCPVDLEIPPGPGRVRAPPAPVNDFRLVAGGERIENQRPGGQRGEQPGRGDVLGAELRDEETAAGRRPLRPEKAPTERIQEKQRVTGPGFQPRPKAAFDDFGSNPAETLAENRAAR